MKCRLSPLTKENCLKMVAWRNYIREGLRTPYMITEAMQEDFFNDVARDRRCKHRYWELDYKDEGGEHPDWWIFAGLVGLTDIEWENGLADISLFLNPDLQGKGIGAAAVELVLEEGFDRMRLNNIYGECYLCSPSLGFWEKMIKKYGGVGTYRRDRKFWNGKHYGSLDISFLEGEWRAYREREGKSPS